ncbi:FHA domain-containing protein [Schumannella soli]|nr:FHA domain-containing protein [Schumannella soli]
MHPDDEDTRPGAVMPLSPPPVRIDDLDDTVQLSTETRHRLLREPAGLAASPPAPRAPRTSAHLTHRVSVAGSAPLPLGAPIIVGRAPRAPRIPDGPPPILVPVVSPLGEVSSAHVELTEVGSAVVVRDLRSTNGTRVIAPGTTVRTLGPGESAVVPAGTVIELGDGVALEVLAPGVAAPQDGEEPR